MEVRASLVLGSQRMAVRTGLLFVCIIALPAALVGQERIDFERDIWPIFEARCADCHAGESAEARFRTDAKVAFFAGGVSGSPIDTESVDASILLRRLQHDSELDQMPLDDEPLSDQELASIDAWIRQGARWPDGVGEQVELESHWAYVAPVQTVPPRVDDLFTRPSEATQRPRRADTSNPIDLFVQQHLVEQQLSPSERAEPATLVRRLYLDLIGLPPTPAQVDSYLSDPRDDRYERLVDSLLASPHYGERWARAWLDLARYADSNGYQADQYREVWPYRDWVIAAMNDDMSFEQFTKEQIAGDLFERPTELQQIATGFHRLTTCNVEAGVDPEENRVLQVIDRVNTTATVWLGSTLECAQCHNHKYDPFTQADYYSLFAYFNQTPLEVEDSGNNIQFNFIGPKLELSYGEQQQRRRASIQTQLSELTDRRAQFVSQRMELFDAWLSERQSEASAPDAWIELELETFRSQGGATGTRLDDGSILVGGERPDKDVYTVEIPLTGIEQIAALRLETLTDESLPGSGPGRHDPERPNFVLYEFRVSHQDGGGAFADPLTLSGAAADFSQANWHVSGAIDNDPKTGWAINPQFHREHWAEFSLQEPLAVEAGSRLRIELDQHYGGCRTIGRFRLLASAIPLSESNLPADLRAVFALEPSDWTTAQQTLVQDHFIALDPEINETDRSIQLLTESLEAIKPATTLVMQEQSEPRDTHVFMRGDFLSPGQLVSPRPPRVLHQHAQSRNDRLGLAEWLCDEANPLTARVFVNRWWSEFFGRGLVRTQDDFGTQGDRPTHPDLLDWLAVEYRSSGSMKQLHRLIVTSDTYQQSSQHRADLRERDPQNLWLARGPRYRLAAETIRDIGLSVSGLRSTEIGGPPTFPPQPPNVWRHVGRNEPKYDTSVGTQRYRRGLYVFWRRSAPYPNFVNFDAPDRASCVVERGRTNTPLQALTLLNGPAYVEMVDAFAQQMCQRTEQLPTSEAMQLAFRQVLSRYPKASELAFLIECYHAEVAREQADDSQLNRADATPAEIRPSSPTATFAERLAGWKFVATVLLNLDETISKE